MRLKDSRRQQRNRRGLKGIKQGDLSKQKSADSMLCNYFCWPPAAGNDSLNRSKRPFVQFMEVELGQFGRNRFIWGPTFL
uniref:Uncharacterized protein n=1 Tax=Globodera rostochiensis TaxID=31243 RepID=A0A914HCR3_GLORO